MKMENMQIHDVVNLFAKKQERNIIQWRNLLGQLVSPSPYFRGETDFVFWLM